MILQQGASCTQAAVANILDISFEDACSRLGPPGKAIHIQTVNELCWALGFCLCEIEPEPHLPGGAVTRWFDWNYYLTGRRALIYVSLSMGYHMYAYRDERFIDPRTGYVDFIVGTVLSVYLLIRRDESR